MNIERILTVAALSRDLFNGPTTVTLRDEQKDLELEVPLLSGEEVPDLGTAVVLSIRSREQAEPEPEPVEEPAAPSPAPDGDGA